MCEVGHRWKRNIQLHWSSFLVTFVKTINLNPLTWMFPPHHTVSISRRSSVSHCGHEDFPTSDLITGAFKYPQCNMWAAGLSFSNVCRWFNSLLLHLLSFDHHCVSLCVFVLQVNEETVERLVVQYPHIVFSTVMQDCKRTLERAYQMGWSPNTSNTS